MLPETKKCPDCLCSFRVEEPNQSRCKICKDRPTTTQRIKRGEAVPINVKALTEEHIRNIARDVAVEVVNTALADMSVSVYGSDETEQKVETEELNEGDENAG